MKKFMILVGLLSLVFLVSCANKENASENVANNNQAVTQVVVEQEAAVEIPVLTAYSDDMLGQAKSTVLFFHSASCGSCRATEQNLLESGTPDDLKILKVNFDEDSELRKKYSIPKYHSFVQVDANGQQIKTWSGSFTLEDIQEQVIASDSDEIAQVVVEESDLEAPLALSGRYSDYGSTLIGATDNTVLFFAAAWCPSCVAADNSLSSATVSDNLTVLKVDFDDSKDLRKKYNVSSQHTFVQIDSEANMLNKWSGGTTLASIESELK